MKNKKVLITLGMIIFPALFLTFCTKNNQTLNTATTTTPSILTSIKGTATLQPQGEHLASTGANMSEWSNAPKLAVLATVPTPGNNIFTGFTGNADSVTIQSMYDATNIYFLVQWQADQHSSANSPWYFNPATKMWAQEGSAPTVNAGVFRQGFVQDEFVMMFNVNNSCRTFNSLSCYAACHVSSSYGTVDTPAGGAMWTNGPTEYLDCWRARTLQVLNENQASDCYVWWGGGLLNKQAVPADTTVASISNKVTLTVTGKTTKVSVPKFVYPATTQYAIYPTGTYANGAILGSDTVSGGLAIRVTAVDSLGNLTLANGSMINPGSGTNYQQVGGGDGQYCIPGSILFPYIGSQADVTANYYWTGTGWQLLLKRALKTADALYDADFSLLNDQPFGLGIMFNGADNEHAIVDGLTLHFSK